MAKFIVTVVRTITTEIEVDAATADRARKQVSEYGVGEAAIDMASQDASVFVEIKSVRPAS